MIWKRPDREKREGTLIGPYGTRSDTSRGRRHAEEEDVFRTVYQRDRDRIVHSAAFRSLQHRTQVFVVHEADFFRTRLTHSLEVSQLARSMALALGGHPDLAEAIALAHDLGHPPFGHAGEEELTAITRQAGLPAFDHNLHCLRIVDHLERIYPDFPGLNLTFETREGIARHETAYDSPTTPDELRISRQPGLETQIANVADVTAYVTHDLEDAVRLGFLNRFDLLDSGIGLVVEGIEASDQAVGGPGPLWGEDDETARVRCRTLIRHLIHHLVRSALREGTRRLDALPGTDVEALRIADRPIMAFEEGPGGELDALRRLLQKRVYNHPRVEMMTSKGRMILRRLYRHLKENPTLLPFSLQERVRDVGIDRVLVDYLAGLTDRGAMDLWKRAFEPYEKTL